MVWIIIFLLVGLFAFLYFRKKLKVYVPGTVNVITGAPKTCKSALTVYLAIKDYKHRLFGYYLFMPLRWLLKRNMEKPLLYSNIPLASVPYVPLTEDLLLRKTRFNYRSVVLFDEFYLIADSMSFKDNVVNTNLSLLLKLFGHETHGGVLYLNTQNKSDLHYAVKRCVLSYLYIFKKTNFPFIIKLSCRELLNSEELDISNIIRDDPQEDESFRNFYVWKNVFKKYDPYAYSILTDSLPVESNAIFLSTKDAMLKTKTILTLKEVKKNGQIKTNESKN